MKWVVCDIWEDHCIECGEPYCYETCAKYRKSRTGRCSRLDGKVFGGRFEGRFLEWGKLELLWHGGVTPKFVAQIFWAVNWLLEPVALFLGPKVYRVYRSVRWRVGRALEFRKMPPNKLYVTLNDPKDPNLDLSVVIPDGAETFRKPLSTGVYELPPLKEGALIRVCSVEGTENLKLELSLIRNSSFVVRNSSIKCVAWDLDDTVWTGTLVEGEVTLKPEVMERIKELDKQGIVSSIVSRNDYDLAMAKLKELGIEEWFVFPQIGWGPKSEAIKKLAKEMNIAEDAILFVDDQAHELNEVAANSGAQVEGLGSRRRELYREEMARRSGAPSEVEISVDSHVEGERWRKIGDRLFELINRTNQLNMSGRRYTREEWEKVCAANEVHSVSAKDGYGDFGVVGVIVVDSSCASLSADRNVRVPVESDGPVIREMAFSCRIAKRGVEKRALDMIFKGRQFAAEVKKTERNLPIREILEEYGIYA